MPSINYEASKEIAPSSERANFRYLNMFGDRTFGGSLVFRVFASIIERPAMIEVGESLFYPEEFEDARDARRIYENTTSLNDFLNAVESKSRESRRISRR